MLTGSNPWQREVAYASAKSQQSVRRCTPMCMISPVIKRSAISFLVSEGSFDSEISGGATIFPSKSGRSSLACKDIS